MPNDANIATQYQAARTVGGLCVREDRGLIQKKDFIPSTRLSYDDAGMDKMTVNVGSVGQPRDRDPRACYIAFDDETGGFAMHRVEYTIVKVQTAMRQANLPEKLITRLSDGR